MSNNLPDRDLPLHPPAELVAHLNRGDCVLFVGDALALREQGSQSARLAAALVDACGAHTLCPVPSCQSDRKCIQPHVCAVPLTRAAQLYEGRSNRQALVDFAIRHVDQNNTPNSVHLALADLPVRVIITTAYDDRLPAALKQVGRPYLQVVRDADVPFDDPGRVQLIRLHGTISQPDSLVLTEDDTADLFGRLPVVSKMIQGHLTSQTLFFVGYRLDDPHFLALYRQVTGPIARYQRLAYAVQPNPDPLLVDRWRGKIILLDAKPLPFLTQLAPFIPVHSKMPGSLGPIIPNNLPSRGEFIGREKELARVRAALASGVFLVCIDGIGGIGKTTLALEAAHAGLKEGLYAGVIWTSAKDRELTLDDVLDIIARTLDYPGVAQQSLVEKRHSVRRLLQAQSYLLVVDNFETITDDAVRDFLQNDLPEPSKALITSREQSLRQAAAISLRELEQDEALQLIRSEGRRTELASIEQASDRVLLRLYEATGGAPLALKWAVGQIRQRGQSLDGVLAALHEAKAEDVFEAMFARSWSLLTEEAQRVLLSMPIFATSASWAAIEAASDVITPNEALGQLVQMSLLEASDELGVAKRRYGIHPLTRAFAKARLQENAVFERAAWERVAEYFLQFVSFPHPEDAKFFRLRNLADLKTLETEWENISAVLDWADSMSQWEKMIQIVFYTNEYMAVRGYWRERIDYGYRAVEAAQRIGDKEALAWLYAVYMAWPYLRIGDFEKAEAYAQEGRLIAKEIGDLESASMAMRYLSRSAQEQGRFDDAQRLAQDALKLAQEHGRNAILISAIHADFGYIALRQEQYAVAEYWFKMAIEEFEREGDIPRAADRKNDLGYAAFAQGRYVEAKPLCEEGLLMSRRFGRQDAIANAQHNLALIAEQEHNFGEALARAQEANEIYQRLGMKEREGTIVANRALIERVEALVEEDTNL